jgi:hypothetical protein
VPYRTSGFLSTVVANNENAEFPIELVRRQAKLEPPLSNITGIQIVTMFAEVTLFGENVARDKVSASGRIQVTFADLVDTQTSCPTD